MSAVRLGSSPRGATAPCHGETQITADRRQIFADPSVPGMPPRTAMHPEAVPLTNEFFGV